MLIEKIGNRGVMFTFDDNITVYLIEADKKYFLCDTHLGPCSMEHIKHYIVTRHSEKEAVVFNSHADWDHIWGNCAFPQAVIIGHERCRERMREKGSFELGQMAQYHHGRVELVFPNLTFSDKMNFAEEEVEFIYAPGHTIDSALCFDRRDAVLFVGDLIEYPIPYLDYEDLEIYLETLEFIKNFPARVKISSHSGIVDDALIEGNIAYIKDVSAGKPIDATKYKGYQSVHHVNMNNLILLRFERIIRAKQEKNFDYKSLRQTFEQWESMHPEKLTEALEDYLKHIERN
jgi:glyoxylase-like metal-dependent hydrolase (beta-lactamase superfamily II)